jgi:hypothetical protein
MWRHRRRGVLVGDRLSGDGDSGYLHRLVALQAIA